MNREKIMRASFFMCIAFDEKPSRRNVQKRIAEANGGKTFSTTEIAAFLLSQRVLVPVEYQPRTKSVPILEKLEVPVVTVETSTLGPLFKVGDEPSEYQDSAPRGYVVKVLGLEEIRKDTFETTVLSEPTSREKSGKVATAERSTKKAESKPREQWVAKAVPIDLPERLPETIADLQIVTHAFVVEFGNCASAQSQEKHGYEYTNAIALARKGGWSTAQLWQAFCDARVAKHGVPIFGAQAKSALSYLPERSRVLPFSRPVLAHIFGGYMHKNDKWYPFRGKKRIDGWTDYLPPGQVLEAELMDDAKAAAL